MLQGVGHAGQALDHAPEHQHLPADAARQAVELHAGHRCEGMAEIDELAHHILRGWQRRGAAVGGRGGRYGVVQGVEAVAHFLHQLPVLVRKVAAQHGGDVLHGQDRAGQPGVVLAQRGGQGRFEGGGRALVWRVGGEQFLVEADSPEPVEQHGAGGILMAEPVEGHDREADGVFAAFGVAPEPEQVLGHAADEQFGCVVACMGARGGCRRGRSRGGGRGPRRQVGSAGRGIRQDPHVHAAAATLHRGDFGIAHGQSCHAAGQCHPAVAIPDGKDPEHDGARGELCGTARAILPPAGGFGQRHVLLEGVVPSMLADARFHVLQLIGAQMGAQLRGKAVVQVAASIGGLDGHLGQAREGLWQHGLFAAPPGCQCRQLQGGAQQVFGNGRQKTQHGRGFQKPAAGAVGHHHVACAQDLQQPGHTERRFGAQLQRVHPVVVHAAQEPVHAHQPLGGFEVELFLVNAQVAAFDQGNAQKTGQIGLLEPCFVHLPRGEQHQRGRFAGAHQRLTVGTQAREQGLIGMDQLGHSELLEGVRKLLPHEVAVFQQITQPRRGLGALGHEVPAPRRTPDEIEGHQMQVMPLRDAVHGAEVAWMALHQGRGQQTIAQQLLSAVDVLQNALQQLRALQDAGRERGPFGGGNQQGQEIDFPRALGALAVGIDVVADAVAQHHAPQAQQPLGEIVRRLAGQCIEEGAPVRGHVGGRQGTGAFRHGTTEQLAVVPGGGRHVESRKRPAGITSRCNRCGVERGLGCIHGASLATAGPACRPHGTQPVACPTNTHAFSCRKTLHDASMPRTGRGRMA